MKTLDLARFFNPLEVLEPDDSRHVELEGITSAKRLLKGMARVIEDDENGGCTAQVVSGLPGSGKSTLLNGLQEVFDRRDTSTLVIRRDLSERIEIGGLPEPGELLGLALAELSLDLRHRTQPDATTDATTDHLLPSVQQFFAALQPETFGVDLATLSVGELRKRMDPRSSFTTRLRETGQTEIQEVLIPRARAAVAELLDRLRAASQRDRIVLILDGIEKSIPRGTHSEAEADQFHDAATQLYVSWIPSFVWPCHLVVTAPPGVFIAESLARYQRKFFVSMAKIRDIARHPYNAGEDLMLEVIRRRHPEAMRLLFGDDEYWARKLVRLSGGFLRELIRLVREGIYENVDEISPIPSDVWLSLIDTYTHEVRSRVATDPFWVLREVNRGKEFRRLENFPEGGRRVLWRMLDRGVVLGYQNGELWCDLHPAFEGDIRLEDSFALPGRSPFGSGTNPGDP